MTGSTSTSLWTVYNQGLRNYCGNDLPEGLVQVGHKIMWIWHFLDVLLHITDVFGTYDFFLDHSYVMHYILARCY